MGCTRGVWTAAGPNSKRTGSFGADGGNVTPALTNAGYGAKVVTLKGSVETPIRLATPVVSALLLAPWNAYGEAPEAHPVPSPPAILSLPQLESITLIPKVVNS